MGNEIAHLAPTWVAMVLRDLLCEHVATVAGMQDELLLAGQGRGGLGGGPEPQKPSPRAARNAHALWLAAATKTPENVGYGYVLNG